MKSPIPVAKPVLHCARCKKDMPFNIGEKIEAVPNANPPIPARLVHTCAVCGQVRYFAIKS